MKTKWIVGISAAMIASGCSTVHRGVVAMKISETTAHVCLNKDEVEVGNSVKLFRSICTSPVQSKASLQKCEKRLIGSGKVTEILNDHYSVVTVASGTEIKEGDFVEK